MHAIPVQIRTQIPILILIPMAAVGDGDNDCRWSLAFRYHHRCGRCRLSRLLFVQLIVIRIENQSGCGSVGGGVVGRFSSGKAPVAVLVLAHRRRPNPS